MKGNFAMPNSPEQILKKASDLIYHFLLEGIDIDIPYPTTLEAALLILKKYGAGRKPG